jgi:hypothetical protein
MSLVFIGIDPNTNGDNCPAVFMDPATGDLLLQGWTVTDPQILADVSGHSPIADHESVVRLPARMKTILLEAVNGSDGAPVQQADRRHDHVGSAPGDA